MQRTWCCWLSLLLAFVLAADASAMTVGTVTVTVPGNPTQVPEYGKIEFNVPLTTASTKPYEADPTQGGVNLSATFTAPDLSTRTVYGFYTDSAWLVRFAPTQTGTWHVDVTATDAVGTASAARVSFTCVASSLHGFVQINGGFLRFSDGAPFYGIGHNNGWQTDVEQPPLANMPASGENLLSFWFANGQATPAMGPPSSNRVPLENITGGLGNYDQTACLYIDGVVARAESAGVYLLPTIWNHAQFEDNNDAANDPGWGESTWANNAYSTIQIAGQPMPAWQFFVTTGAGAAQWRYQQNFYRYILARWGYSQSIVGWVGMCEMNGTNGWVYDYGFPLQAPPIPGHNTTNTSDWCAAVRSYFAQNDNFRTNAQGAYPLLFSLTDEGCSLPANPPVGLLYWPKTWPAAGGTDIPATDSYASQIDNIGIAATVALETGQLRSFLKPVVVTEFGGWASAPAPSWPVGPPPPPYATQPAHLHNGIWAGFAAGTAMTPLLWCDNGTFPMLTDATSGAQMQAHLKIHSDFVATCGALACNNALTPTTPAVSDPNCKAWAMQMSDHGYVWVQNTVATTLGGQTLTLSSLTNGPYTVAWYDVWTSGATPLTTTTGTAAGNSLAVTVPALAQADIACIFSPVTVTPITFTAGPAATPNPANVGQLVNFTSAATGGTGALAYTWTFGDGGTGTVQNPTHTYPTTGSFTATVIATDILGVHTSATVAVAVNKQSTLGFLYALNDKGGSCNYIYGFAVNDSDGSLAPLSGSPFATGGNGDGAFGFSERMALDSLNGRLYVLNAGSNTVFAFAINAATGALTALPCSPINLGVPGTSWATLAVQPNGSPLVVGDSKGYIASFNITATAATPAVGSPFPTGTASPLSTAFSQDGNYVYTGGGATTIACFSVNASTGVLSALNGTPFAPAGVGSPLAYTTDSAGRLFIADSSNVYACTTSAGVPTLGNNASGIGSAFYGVLHPNGFYVEVENMNSNVGVFQISGSGLSTTLTKVSSSAFPTNPPNGSLLALNRNGNFLFAANLNANLLATFGFNTSTGALTNKPNSTVGAGVTLLTGMAYVAQPAPIVFPAPTATFNPTDVGQTVNFVSAATGGAGALTYAWDFGDNKGTGTVQNPTYTYTAAGSLTAAVTATDTLGVHTSSNVVVTVNPAIVFPTVPTATPNPAGVGQTVTFSSAATGGTGALTYAWTFGDNKGPGTVQNPTYTYTAAGSLTATVTATDTLGLHTSANVVVTVNPANANAPAITSATTASGTVGVAFSYQITASNSPTGYNATSLPSWASVDTNTGAITGTPAAIGSNNVTISATNASGTGSATLSINIASQAPAITSTLTATGTVGQQFSYTITATGATPMTFSAQPLPNGLGLSGARISGTPTAAGQTNITIGAANSSGSDSKTLQLTINPQGAATITSPLTATGQVSAAFTYKITASGNATITFGATGLPAWLSFSVDTLSGTPTAMGTANVTLSAGNSLGTDTETLAITINAAGAPAITSALTASATEGTAFSYQIAASGMAPMTFAAANLPAGLNIAGDTISGTPTVCGETAIQLTATNTVGTDTESLILTIAGAGTPTAPTVTSPLSPPQPVAAGQPVTLSTAASDPGVDLLLYTWDLGDGTTGVGSSVTHIYTSPGVYSVTVTISNGVSSTTETVTVVINPPGVTTDPTQFKVSKSSLKFTFKKTKADNMSFTGTLPVAKGFSPNKKSLRVFIGGYTSTFALSAKGKGSNSMDSIQLSGKLSKAGGYTASPVKFTYAVKKQTLLASLLELGFSNGDVKKQLITMPILIDLDGDGYLANVKVTYTAKKDKTGSAK
ncbi:MAG: PKD domain-containing protein [Planctomycetota bacterium]